MGTGLVGVWKLTLDSIIVLLQFCLDGITAELLQWLQYVDSHCWLPAKLSVVPDTDVHWWHVQLLARQHLQWHRFDYQVTSIYIIYTTFFVCQFNYQCQNTNSFFPFNPSPKLNESTCSLFRSLILWSHPSLCVSVRTQQLTTSKNRMFSVKFGFFLVLLITLDSLTWPPHSNSILGEVTADSWNFCMFRTPQHSTCKEGDDWVKSECIFLQFNCHCMAVNLTHDYIELIG